MIEGAINLRWRCLVPANRVVARVTGVSEVRTMRVGMAVATVGEGDPSIARPLIGRGIVAKFTADLSV